MPEERDAVCLFCGRNAAQAGVLIQAARGAICEDCSRVAVNLAEDRRAGLIQRDGRIEIAQYRPDVALARLIGEANMTRHLFVPLDVRGDRVVLAVAGIESAEEIKLLVFDALDRAAPGRPHDPIDVVLADPRAILDKIASGLSAT